MKIDVPDYRHPPQNREITNAGLDMCQGAGEAGAGPGRLSGSEAGSAAGGRETHGVSRRATTTVETSAGSATAATFEEVTEGVDDPDFQIAAEVLYHGARRDFFLGAHRWAMFLAIVFGASAATAFGAEKLCGLLAAVAAAADMAFDFVGRGSGPCRRETPLP